MVLPVASFAYVGNIRKISDGVKRKFRSVRRIFFEGKMPALTKNDALTKSDISNVKTDNIARLNGSKPNGVADRALVDLVEQKLKNGAGPAADYLNKVVDGSEPPKNARVTAAMSVLDRSGYGAQSRIAAPPIKPKKDLSDMSADELRSIAGALQTELSNRAKVIDHEPSNATDSEDIADLLG